MKKEKYRLLRTGLLYDAVGMATLAIPVVGPFIDMVWAPISAKKMMEMYPGKRGKTMAIINFLEEILPYTDVIPTFTLMWLYSYVWNPRADNGKTIDAEVVWE